MSHTELNTIKGLCSNSETATRAIDLFHTAKAKTAPGSGYELGKGRSGLPAICAYIASQECVPLGDGDVSETIAQTTACLDPKVFTTTLNTVRAALATSAIHSQEFPHTVTYETLISEKKLGRQQLILKFMKDVEATLAQSPEIRDRYELPCDIITIPVFCWTCRLLTVRALSPVFEILLDNYDISADEYEEITHILNARCKGVAAKIMEKVAEFRTLRASAAARNSALKSKSATTTPTKTPIHKRKVAFDGPIIEEDELDIIETPSKRRKLSTPLNSTPLRILPTPRTSSRLSARGDTNLFPAPAASSSQLTLDLMQAAESEDELAAEMITSRIMLSETFVSQTAAPSTPRRPRAISQPSSVHTSEHETPRRRSRAASATQPEQELAPRRRFRPVFLDQYQWVQRDPKLEREWKAAEQLRRQMVPGYERHDPLEADRTEGTFDVVG
ncbi:hypothetical protein A0H81_08398 [Grifola frondosa]|uniref:Uncharacterized protein n=1 Tax=Grifola frondosa TaxID=5627 RepID=A0A1C7M3B6_GRIFR|nr:hypothetical protein A0H81_08398 [Grifola frondosa]